jgi:tetratricopeptide (TPR) repeat protein
MKKKQMKKQARTGEAVSAPPQPVGQKSPALIAFLIAAVMVAGLGVASSHRNVAFKTPVTLWADTSAKSVNKRRTHENYGQALSTYGFYNDAIREFKTVLALPDDGSVPMRDVYREIGVVYFRIGMIDDSIVSWQTGLRFAPYDPSLLNNLSVAFLRQQRYNEAEQAIRQALAGAPYMPQALNSLGEILMVKGNYEEALKYFLEAIRVSPEGASRYWNAALAYEKTGRYDMAFQYANQYAAMEPDPALRQRAMVYMESLKNRYSERRK